MCSSDLFNISELIKFLMEHWKHCTVSAVNILQRFGILEIDEENKVNGFREKDDSDGNLINVGFMVCNPEIFGYIKGDSIMLEKEPLVNLSKDGQLMAYRHEGFWQCMDTKRQM